MDEPLSNLGAKLWMEMRNAIKEIQKSVNTTAAALSSILSVITIISLLIFFKLSGKHELSM
jgi:ABC-type sulfate/molybdate transport systems ATPase subunit